MTYPTIIAGCFAGGTSAVAGLAYAAGVFLGRRFVDLGRLGFNAKGSFESVRLHAIVNRALPIPEMVPREDVSDDLAVWFCSAASAAAEAGKPVAAKMPQFSLMGPCLRRALPAGFRVIEVERPLEVCVRSARARWGPRFDPDAVEACVREMHARKGSLDGGRGRLVVAYEDAVDDPIGTMRRIAEFTGSSPGPASETMARVFIDASMDSARQGVTA